MLVIPAIDLIGGRCVRLHQGDYARQRTYPTDPLEMSKRLEAAGFRRLHVIDLDAARGQADNREVIRRIAQESTVPIQMGGGVRTTPDVEELLDMGVQRLIVGTALLERPETVGEWTWTYGAEHFTGALDLRRGRLQCRGWLSDSDSDLQEVLDRVAALGIDEVISTDVESDGTLGGPNRELYAALRRSLSPSVRLLAAGGVTSPRHLEQLAGLGVTGAVVGRALYEGEHSLKEWADAG